MSHVQDLYRQEAMGLVSSREFDRLFDDAVEQDMVDASVQKNIDDAYEEYIEQARKEYYDGLLNAMTPHERKHALKPSRMDLKGGHHHRRNYCICNMCGHWFRRNKGIHDEDKYGPIHICGGVCDELAIQSANLEADVGGGFQANYWDQEEIEEWEKKNGRN